MKATILWVEGRQGHSALFVPNLRKNGYSVETVSSGRTALERLPQLDPDIVVVNAASLRTSGKRICYLLREQVGELPIILITNPEKTFSGETRANEVLTLPFTVRKLVNRIASLVPGDGQKSHRAGPICLDLERNMARCQGRETHLTPRLVELLQILMQHPGEVVERNGLFRQVWKTEYTGDTRTLDVHMSWLRRVLEIDPRRPRFLKTIRGVGYRLDV